MATDKNYGFIPDEIKPEDYVFGGGNLSEVVLQEDGQWDKYIPEREIQNKNTLETSNCTSFGTLNCIETLIRRKFGVPDNYSDRYLGVVADTTKNGNSPHKVAETIRKDYGCVLEEELPFTLEINTWSEYYSPKPMTVEYLVKGQHWLNTWTFKHEWVFVSGSVESKQERLMEALKYSPIGVSVRAWPKRDGLYYKTGNRRDNHWTMLYGYEKGKYWKVFDSYDNTHKKLEWDYDFEFAKRYWLDRNLNVEERNHYLQLLQKMADLLRDMFNMAKEGVRGLGRKLGTRASSSSVVELLRELVALYQRQVMLHILQESKKAVGTDVSPLHDELGCAESVNTIVRRATRQEIGGGASTYLMYQVLENSGRFEEISHKDVQGGEIIISPTGYGTGAVSNGHVGIMGTDRETIYSNNSRTFLWDTHLTYSWWVNYYKNKGGYPVKIYKVKR